MSCIVVLGLPRSGTSVVAGILHHLGVFMGEYLQGPNTWNPKGSFEDLEFVSLHVQSLGNGGFRYAHDNLPCTPAQMPQEWHNLIAKRKALGIPWGFKCSHAQQMFGNVLVKCQMTEIQHTPPTQQLMINLPA